MHRILEFLGLSLGFREFGGVILVFGEPLPFDSLIGPLDRLLVSWMVV